MLDAIDIAKTELREVAAERGRERDLISRLRRTAIVATALFPDHRALPAEQPPLYELDPGTAGRICKRVVARDAATVKFLQCKEEVTALVPP